MPCDAAASRPITLALPPLPSVRPSGAQSAHAAKAARDGRTHPHDARERASAHAKTHAACLRARTARARAGSVAHCAAMVATDRCGGCDRYYRLQPIPSVATDRCGNCCDRTCSPVSCARTSRSCACSSEIRWNLAPSKHGPTTRFSRGSAGRRAKRCAAPLRRRGGPGADVGGVSPSPGTDVAGVSPVPAQMWPG
jgi:hypothetical protein